jgi:hypothetical protein
MIARQQAKPILLLIVMILTAIIGTIVQKSLSNSICGMTAIRTELVGIVKAIRVMSIRKMLVIFVRSMVQIVQPAVVIVRGEIVMTEIRMCRITDIVIQMETVTGTEEAACNGYVAPLVYLAVMIVTTAIQMFGKFGIVPTEMQEEVIWMKSCVCYFLGIAHND